MEICHTVPLKLYNQLPELIKNNSKLIIREANICDMSAKDIWWVKHLSKEVIVWFDNYLTKSEILPITATVGAQKIICPVQSLGDVNEVETAFIASNIKPIVNIISSKEKDYLTVLGKALKSEVIIGIAFDYTYMLKPFKSFSVPPFAVRPRLIEYANVLYGLSLYNKEFYCLNMCGALSEILLLKSFGLVSVLATDVAVSLARSQIKIDDETMIPTDFNMRFVKKYHIDDPYISYNVSPEMYKIIKNNIKVMEEYNGD